MVLNCNNLPLGTLWKGILLYSVIKNAISRSAQNIKGFIVFSYKKSKIVLLLLILIILNNISSWCGHNFSSNL